MPRDVFEVMGIDPRGTSSRQPRDVLGSRATNNNQKSDMPNWLQKTGEFVDNSPALGGLANFIANSAPVNIALGAGDAVRNNVAHLANLAPGVNIPMAESGEGLPYTLGNIGGEIGSFMAGGGALNAGRKALEAAPMIGKFAQMLGGQGASGIARRAVGSGMYGALTNEDNRDMGALKGVAISAGLDVLPGALKAGAKFAAPYAKNITSKFQPEEFAHKFITSLGGGKSLEESGRLLAAKIKETYNNAKEVGNDAYNRVFSAPFHSADSAASRQIKSVNIYGNRLTDGKWNNFNPFKEANKNNPSANKVSAYKKAYEKSVDFYGGSHLKGVNDAFLKKPSLENAHKLQSQLGDELRALEAKRAKSGLDQFENDKFNLLTDARAAINKDIDKFLGKKDVNVTKGANLKKDYEAATRYWDENVSVYSSNPTLSKIAKGTGKNQVENPTTAEIISIFKNPERSIQTIANQLGSEGKNKILFAELGKLNESNFGAQNLAKAIDGLKKQGLESYVSKEMANDASTLKGIMRNRETLERVGGALGAGGLASLTGVPLIELAALIGGYKAGPSIYNTYLKAAPKHTNITSGLAAAIKKKSPQIKTAIRATQIPGDQ
jgi:hypothetical protein